MSARDGLLLDVFCALVAAGGVAVAAWVLISGGIGRVGLDDLFLVLVCLLFAAMFAAIPARTLRARRQRRPPPEGADERRAQD